MWLHILTMIRKKNNLVEKACHDLVLFSNMMQPFNELIQEHQMVDVAPINNIVGNLSAMEERASPSKSNIKEL